MRRFLSLSQISKRRLRTLRLIAAEKPRISTPKYLLSRYTLSPFRLRTTRLSCIQRNVFSLCQFLCGTFFSLSFSWVDLWGSTYLSRALRPTLFTAWVIPTYEPSLWANESEGLASHTSLGSDRVLYT